jgi:hypothetical protein
MKDTNSAWHWLAMLALSLVAVLCLGGLVLLLVGCVIVRSGLPGNHAESSNPACLVGCTAQASTAASGPASGARP